MNPLIYVDDCLPTLEKRIFQELGVHIVRRMDLKAWSVNDAMAIITDPNVILAVFNKIDDVSLMEISLLHFMCKPILVTSNSIELYPTAERTVDYIEAQASLKNEASNFINWFKWWENS